MSVPIDVEATEESPNAPQTSATTALHTRSGCCLRAAAPDTSVKDQSPRINRHHAAAARPGLFAASQASNLSVSCVSS
jgi:hypothetical protein